MADPSGGRRVTGQGLGSGCQGRGSRGGAKPALIKIRAHFALVNRKAETATRTTLAQMAFLFRIFLARGAADREGGVAEE